MARTNTYDAKSGKVVNTSAGIISFRADDLFRDRAHQGARMENQTLTAYIKGLINRDLERKGI